LTGKAFEADVGRGWAAKAGWRWEEENFMLVDLNRRHRDATNMLHKVKLILVHSKLPQCADVNYSLPLELHPQATVTKTGSDSICINPLQ
jgi:hypothetical protein